MQWQLVRRERHLTREAMNEVKNPVTADAYRNIAFVYVRRKSRDHRHHRVRRQSENWKRILSQ